MPFRDDHDAAVALASALENEVKRERAHAEQLRRERDALAEKLARNAPRRRLLILQPTPSKSGGHEMLFLIFAMLGLFVLGTIIAMNG